MMENWPPLKNGTRVRTIPIPDGADDWTEEAKVVRRFGVFGTIVHYHDSHGLCYDVRHDDGIEGCYDSRELAVLLDGREIQIGELLEILHEWGWEKCDQVCPTDGTPCRHSRANIALKEVKNVMDEISSRRKRLAARTP